MQVSSEYEGKLRLKPDNARLTCSNPGEYGENLQCG